MADDKRKKPYLEDEEGDSSTGTGTGGQGSGIAFHDFVTGAEKQRDDMLPADEKKRLLSVHQGMHEGNVKKQKELREERKALKDGKIPLDKYRQGLKGGAQSQYKAHPTLSNKAQFSGIDRQVNHLPTENVADTNQANRNELQNQYRLRYAPQNAPTFNPKPQHR